MARRNGLIFAIVLIILALALAVVFPINKGLLGNKGIRLGLDLQGGTRIVYDADLTGIALGDVGSVMEGAIAVLENRINPLGVAESDVRRLGADQILVEIPGRSLTDREKESLARVALLEFGELASENETSKWENDLGKWKPATATINGQEVALTSKFFKDNTFVRQGDLGEIDLVFNWDAEGSKISEVVTGRLIGKPLGIFDGADSLIGENGRPIAPTVQAVIVDSGRITGLSLKEATQLSKQLNAGRLPIPLSRTGDEKNVEPWLGADFVSKSLLAGLFGIAATMIFMIIYYRISGFTASLALAYYAILTLAVFKLLNVTLTLAGIGGFILSIGMAIDANVLIFERMKEELWSGKTLGSAIEAGFKRAFSAIYDSNITTILAGAVLLWLGSSNIVASDQAKGFAVTLIIGVIISMFTALLVTRAFIRPFVNTGLAHKTWFFAPYQRRKNDNV